MSPNQAAPPGGSFLVRWIDGTPARARWVDSITEAVCGESQLVLFSGSHGGSSAARFALEAAPRLVVFNDAGLGLAEAGVAGLAILQQAGIAAVAVSHATARIGDARSSYFDGWVSRANVLATALGAAPQTAVRAWLPRIGG
jgi:hypothetical protein